ncbi:hypothetical protein IVB30_05100 [Bradyrhizobium sp. 200]|uniref:hypothetical protein n=1 Tax=Bradyrhizobium sp. 200 TaxID=2782665 RepID=UPI001FFEA236|nr:hypothetical protein [Bradyrhizobium sp. 200]UPJ50781.1 hypothetical protein IVB30_05100 [Bradyrhizobium sp. 200]
MPLPDDSYLLALLREAMRLYEEALPTATDTQKLVWKYCSRAKFIEGAWPYDVPDVETSVVISVAMGRCIDALMPPEAALKIAKCSAAASRRFYA